MRRGSGGLLRLAAVAVVFLVGVVADTASASATTTYGPGDTSYDAYYANPLDKSTWAPFCAGAGDGVSYSGVQALGVPAGGPTPSDDSVGIDIGSTGQGGPTEYGFQCIELAAKCQFDR